METFIIAGFTYRYPHLPDNEIIIDQGTMAGYITGQELRCDEWKLRVTACTTHKAWAVVIDGKGPVPSGKAVWVSSEDSRAMHTRAAAFINDERLGITRTHRELGGDLCWL